ncbi:signal transduction histidine kinase [Sporomusaceae bacterium BoRhaA]|uniref:sensor histidine kinase n=1 Tax=Pelorhabdus rhamnosifermentans TaxID=2772457 RepID=UPI001C063C8C|nr:ATP-binding protein [Pelorhabdus rhamnosifermentans]MBU2699370.1 signal transduction histidine kinase [Pelorhabdus rhamnosifermentans]
MWLRIKQLAIPISIKLTILYATILSCTLLFTSVLTVAGLYYVLYTQADDDITLSTNSIMHYLSEGNPLDQHLLKENILVPGIILRIFDNQHNLLIDSAPYMPGNHALTKEDKRNLNPLNFFPIKKRTLKVINVDHVYFYYDNQMIWQNGHLYQLYIMKTMSEQTHFLKTLVKSLLVTNLIGLLIAIISGTFISRRILHPIRDITDTAKEIEVNDLGKRIALTNSNDELQELARTFNHMLHRIQTGFEQQRRFVSDASHELRTPITVISGYADMLDRWGKQDPSVINEGIEAIKSEASNMYGLIEKLLFLARTDQSKQIITKTLLAMEDLIDEVVQETHLIAPNHHIVLHQNDEATIYADASSIKQMLRIFIENSIKYTATGGTISIVSRQTVHHLEVIIQDTGIGIPEEDQPKIFDRFYRVDKSRSKITGGTGLGLSIARWIAEKHDSTIQLTSLYGQGTTVTVRIPLASSQ